MKAKDIMEKRVSIKRRICKRYSKIMFENKIVEFLL